MSNDLLSLAGWYFLPNMVTGWVQSAFYAIGIRAGEPKPQPGSRAFVSHRRKIQILVILAYLLFTIYEADNQLKQAGDFYRDLGVTRGVDERGLQSRFRQLTRMYHPDKIPAENQAGAEAYYVHLKFCRDILVDPAKRFAYDRLGPEIISWQHKTSISDYLSIGVRNLITYYIGTGAVLIALGVMGYLKQAAFWRYLALASLFTFELHTITSPTPPKLLSHILNPLLSTTHLRHTYLPFQAISLFRKLVLTFFIALSQIGPLLTPSSPSPHNSEISPQQLQNLGNVTMELQREANMLMKLQMTPLEDEKTLKELRGKMRRFLVDNTVRSDGRVRDALGRVLERRRLGVPSGAVGNS